MGRQTSGEAQSPSAAQRSSSCSFIRPPLLLDAVVEEDVVEEVVEATVEDAFDDEVTFALELDTAPPVPVLGPVAPEPLLDEVAPPLPEAPVLGGTHWALALHV